MIWSFNQTEPVFLQIAQGLRAQILSGKLPPGSVAPTVRQLAADTAVNPNTVQRALTLLEEEGLLHTQGTTGRFVTTDQTVLQAAREALLQRTAARFVREVHSMGLCAKDLIRYIEKEEERYE